MTDELESVARWIETSGRALELRVARAFQREGAQVRLSHPYLDGATARETDVLAQFSWTGVGGAECQIVVSAECKHSLSNPWIAFYDDAQSSSTADELKDWTVFHHGSYTALTESLGPLWLTRNPFTEHRTAATVVSAHSKDKNYAHDAVRQALSAAKAQQELYIRTQAGNHRRAWVILAVVVTTAHLFASQLDNDGNVVVTPVDRFDVWGHNSTGGRQRVYVRSERSLTEFVAGLRNRVDDADIHARSQE